MVLAILNTSILTIYGTFEYAPVTLSDAIAMVQSSEILSAIGHQSTADILTALLGVEICMNRIQFSQNVGQQALVFKLKGRPPEGVILSADEIEAIGYEFGLLTRTA